MTTVVTGATGKYGRIVIESLLAKGIPGSEIIAAGRQVEKLNGLGVTGKYVSYDDPQSLHELLTAADKLLFVSGIEMDKRIQQHQNIVDAAAAARVPLVVYTSAAKADTTDMQLAAHHRLTEKMLAESGLSHVILRNNWYLENYDIPLAVEHGLFGAAGNGRICAAPRADYAEAAATVLAEAGHQGSVYELGSAGFTLTELAAEIARQSGRPVTYTDLTPEKYTELLIGFGVPDGLAAMLADADRAAAQGALDVPKTDLEDLLGRPATPLSQAIREMLAK